MTEAKHTPGPWEVKRAALMTDGAFDFGIIARIDGEPQVIAETFGRTDTNVWPNAEANAHLIKAAPEMREALKAAEEWLEGWASAEPCLSTIRAALKSADGETE